MNELPGFEEFVAAVEPRLRRALLGSVGVDRVEDAVAEALAYGFEHWEAIGEMSNPAGYLFRVAQSRVRQRRTPRLFAQLPVSLPDVEPGLIEALCALPDAQRTAVWLAHGCGSSHGDIADALGVSTSTVATHVSRALNRLRAELGVVSDADA